MYVSKAKIEIMNNIVTVMISSTAKDLPEHRKQVMDACISLRMLPSMMEHLSASHEDAVEISLKMVEDADIYIGIFGHRYGYIPAGYDISITEMEYHHAITLGKPTLIFIMDDKHSFPKADLDAENTDKLEALLSHLKVQHIVNFFASPDDLRAKVILSLSQHKTQGQLQPLYESRDFSSHLQNQMALLNKSIDQLTQEQLDVMNSIRHRKRMAIAGCAGSGKTLLAVEKAIRLDNAGMQTLFLCHSSFLADYVRKLMKGTQVKVVDFTTWIANLSGNKEYSETWSQHVEPSSKNLDLAFDNLLSTKSRYDAIIVDEGQDFREIWWTLIEAGLNSAEHGILYIFHDDNQTLLPQRAKYPIHEAPFFLTKNCRNSGEVFDMVSRFHPQAPHIVDSLQGLGIVNRYIYDGETETPIPYIQQAIYKSLEDVDTQRVVILSTEPEPISNSILNNQTITLPRKWRWQDAIQKYLGDILLSDEPHPTEDDIWRVTKVAKRKRPKNPKYYKSERINRDEFKWQITGNIIDIKTRHSFERTIGFLASEYWSQGIPKPTKISISAQYALDECIFLTSVSAYKGLEAETVILFVPYPFRGTIDQLKSNLYVGMSRARYMLSLVIDKNITYQIDTYLLE